jgi:siderophore synthetase component
VVLSSDVADDLHDPVRARAELARLRPDLLERYDAALPAASAAILGRLLGALAREPLPGLAGRREAFTGLQRVTFASGLVVIFPTAAAAPFAAAAAGLTARLFSPPASPLPHGGVPPADTTEPAELARWLWPGASLAAELDNSVANLALAMATQPPAGDPRWTLRGAQGDPDGLGRMEQLVIDGHPLHPCCRTRDRLDVAGVLAWAPEHRTHVRLRKLAVPEPRWLGAGPPILYAHPFQAARLRDEHPWLTDAGETGPGRPLMSLRTVALDKIHIKTAVDVRMTSAIRTVSPAAVHNGPRLSALLTELTRDLPLTVLSETAAGAVIVGGEPQRRMAHLRRTAPVPGRGEAIVPLGALKAGTPPLLTQAVAAQGGDPYRWLEDLAKILLPPLTALLDRGIALEAHGQNTLVGLENGRPVRTLYRDLGGVRVSRAAAVLGTVAAEIVALLARHHDASRERLWGIIASALPDQEMRTGPLPLKATTAMRLAADPLRDVWCHLDNPMAGA